MSRSIRSSAAILGMVLLFAACDSALDPSGPTASLTRFDVSPASDCQLTPRGTTALFVNQSVIGTTIDLSAAGCDIAIYFDAEAPDEARVSEVTVLHESGTNAGGTGVFNDGADVVVERSRFLTDVKGQYVPIRFENGATGSIVFNELLGTHRSGIIVRGTGTQAHIRGNSVVGTGAKTSGWAENGLQIDQGAAAKVTGNRFVGHWWDGGGSWGSSALLASGASELTISNNDFVDNEFGMYLVGNGYEVKGNVATSSILSEDYDAYGIILAGSNNHIAGNRLSAADGAAGIYVFGGSKSNRITGNRISGFPAPIVDDGDANMIRGKPVPVY